MRNRNPKNYAGMKYGRLTAISLVRWEKPKPPVWHWRCDCGNETETAAKNVVSGHTQSCGCLASEALGARNRTHGLSHSERNTYRSWKDMRARCFNANKEDYPNYGGRGIGVCSRWDDFASFLADMGRRPEGLTLDRIDVDGDYDPSNCRWADAETQANNKRSTIIIERDGVKKSLSQWARDTGIEISKASYRYRNGLDPFSDQDFRL